MENYHDIKFRAECIHDAVFFYDSLRQLVSNSTVKAIEFLVMGVHDESPVECRMVCKVDANVCRKIAIVLGLAEISETIQQASDYHAQPYDTGIEIVVPYQKWPQ